MLSIINDNLTDLIGGSGKCRCYDQSMQKIIKETMGIDDSEQCYRDCCIGAEVYGYEYINLGLSFLHNCNEAMIVRFEKTAKILSDTSKIFII